MGEDLGLVDHVDCLVFLSNLKLEDTVERLPSRHLALSLCTEDVKAQCEALTPETRERLNNVLSQTRWIPTRLFLWRMLTVTSKSVEIHSCVCIVTFL